MLVSVEADRRAGEEAPRFTVRSLQSFEGMTANARLILDIETVEADALPLLAALLEGHGGGRGEVWLNAVLPNGGIARILLGRSYLLDAELANNIERVPGVKARLRPAPPLQLALVS